MTAPAYEHNGQPVSAEAFYAIACDPRRHVAVEACAGAGKTWMLVSRMVRALLDGVQPQDILAITFTKKAAGEMRERLSDWLTAFADMAPDALRQELALRGYTEAIVKNSPVGTVDITSLLQQLKQTVQQNGRPVQIRTFHSWFASLLKTAPLAMLHDLGLPSVYTLLENEDEAIAEVWPAFFECVVASPELLTDFEHTVQAHGRTQTLKALTAALGKRIEFGLADAHGVLARSVKCFDDEFMDFAGLAHPDEALAAGGVYRRTLDFAALNLAQASAPSFAAKGVDLQTALASGKVDEAFDAMLTQEKAGVRSGRKFSDKVPRIDDVRTAQDCLQRVLGARQQLEAHLHQQRMARLTRVLIAEYAKLKRARGWIDMPDVERAAHAMLSHPTLSGWVQQRLDARVRHLLIDEFQDTSPLQWQALSAWLSGYVGAGGGGGDGPRVFIVGDPKQSIYRFRRAEPQVFLAAQAFVRDGLGGDVLSCDHTRRNATGVVHAVNSAMQSAQLAGDYADYRAHTTASTQTGGVWRLPAIAVDAADGPDNGTGTDEGDGDGSADGWRDSLTTPRFVAEETRLGLECRQLAQWIHGLLNPNASASDAPPTEPIGGLATLRPQHIMVLSRRRNRLSRLEEELRRLHIPALQPEKNKLGDAPEVKDIIALLDALLSPGNDLALAQTLKSPLFACSDDDLIGLALLRRAQTAQQPSQPSQPRPPPTPWLSLLATAQHGTRDWPAIAAQLAAWQARLASVPPHDALHTIYEDADLIARFAAAAPAASRSRVIANLQALLAAALDFDGGRYATPYALVRALKAGRIPAPVTAHPEAVQLLTVHGAKGLEAPLVVLLDTDGAAPKPTTMGVLVDWPGEAPAPTRFSFLASETRPPRCNADALATEIAARHRESLNGLYVAMTRARHTLVLSSNAAKRPEPGSWWARLSPLATPLDVRASADVQTSVDVLAATAAPQRATFDDAPHFTIQILPFLHNPIQLLAPKKINKKGFLSSTIPSESPLTEASIDAVDSVDSPDSLDSRLGQAMHLLLEGLPLDDAEGTGPFWTPSQIEGVAQRFLLDPTQARQAADMAHGVRAGEGAWAWQAAEVAWDGVEVPLTVHAKLLRLDRLVQRRRDASWWVFDYKSAAHPLAHPDYVAQLQSYRTALQKLLPGQTVHAAFLTPQGKQFNLS